MEADLAPHPVISLALQVGDVKTFPHVSDVWQIQNFALSATPDIQS